MAIWIRQASYVVRAADRVERDTDILIEGSHITSVGRFTPPEVDDLQVIDGRGRVVIPGLVNAPHAPLSEFPQRPQRQYRLG